MSNNLGMHASLLASSSVPFFYVHTDHAENEKKSNDPLNIAPARDQQNNWLPTPTVRSMVSCACTYPNRKSSAASGRCRC
jgi:hypothetical protein